VFLIGTMPLALSGSRQRVVCPDRMMVSRSAAISALLDLEAVQ
jgi:hypothetical protein